MALLRPLRAVLFLALLSVLITGSYHHFNRADSRKQHIDLGRPEPLAEDHASDAFDSDSMKSRLPPGQAEEVAAAPVPAAGDALQTKEPADVNYQVHIFYYAWYANPDVDGRYLHWNHELLPHWNPSVDRNFPKGRHVPPDNLGANFYPLLGPYSSNDDAVIEAHMLQMVHAGTGVVVVSWYNPSRGDDQGISPDPIVPKLLQACLRHQLKLTFHMEPFKGRKPHHVRSDVEYLVKTYGHHPALYRHKTPRGDLPLLYVYDSYHNTKDEWRELLIPGGELSIRGTDYDAVFIGLVVEANHLEDIAQGGFDGFYTYFAANGFTYGSTQRNWAVLAKRAREKGLIFIPSVGPGYLDTRVRPWNEKNARDRKGGETYSTSFEAAIKCRPEIISVTSFNEWHEGTQIEEAVPKTIEGYSYEDYLPSPPDFYLLETKKHIKEYEASL